MNTEVDNSTEETGTNSSEDSTANNDIEIKATNFEFDQAEYTVKAGEEVKISLVNEEGSHGIAIDDLDVKIDGDGDATLHQKNQENTQYIAAFLVDRAIVIWFPL